MNLNLVDFDSDMECSATSPLENKLEIANKAASDLAAEQDMNEIIRNYESVKHMGTVIKNGKRSSTRVKKRTSKYCDEKYMDLMLDGVDPNIILEQFKIDAVDDVEDDEMDDDWI